MKTKYTSQSRSAGYGLLLVMIMCAISLLILAGIMNRTSTISKLNDRNNKYTVCSTVAASATEKVFAQMAYDFQSYGLGTVTNNYSGGIYASNVPNSAESSYWTNFVFSDAQGNTNKTYVTCLTNYNGALPSQYTNLFTTIAPIYRIVSNVSLASNPDIIGTAQEDVLLALLPITTYAIFYNGPLEFTWTANMTVKGRTHANDIICVGTSATNIFTAQVTSTKTVGGPTRDGSTPSPWNQGVNFKASYITNVPSITVAFAMTNSHAIIDIPPAGESVSSQLGKERIYNKAQVLIMVTNYYSAVGKPLIPTVNFTIQQSILSALPGADSSKLQYTYYWTNFVYSNVLSHVPTNIYIFTNVAASTQPSGIDKFLSLTNTFTDRREYQTNLYVTQIDVIGCSNWLGTNGFRTTKLGSSTPPTIFYVADQRNVGTNKLAVVRLVNGTTLPANCPSAGAQALGWTLATPNPLYVQGDYNITQDGVHFAINPDQTTNSGTCVPAALMCDAITILSSKWSDIFSSTNVSNNAGKANGNGILTNTINAAIITGNVPSTDITATTFSGGVHNLMRLQEDWTTNSANLVLNTSIVVLWSSQMATNQFRNPIGYSPAPIYGYYRPPTRLWGFDPNFFDPTKQPQGVPTALVPIRFNWAVPPAGSITYSVNNW